MTEDELARFVAVCKERDYWQDLCEAKSRQLADEHQRANLLESELIDIKWKQKNADVASATKSNPATPESVR